MKGLTSIEDAETFMLKHGENIVDILGGEVDRIEKNLKVQWLDFASFITCVSYAEARNRYRLDVRLSVRPSVTRWHYQKGWIYCQAFFTKR